MNPAIVGIVVFTCTLGGALLGMWLRAALPEHHLEEDSKDTIQVGIGLIATLTALVLGFVTASAKSSFDTVDAAVRTTATDILTLDRLLARYGPETGGIRADFQRLVAHRIDMMWPQNSSRPPEVDPWESEPEAEALVHRIRSLMPNNASQRTLQTRALEVAESLLKTRWMVAEQTRKATPLPFLVILLFWLTITFASFGLFAPKNLTVFTVLLLCALSISSALFLVLEMEGPFDGLVKISADPWRYALGHLNQ
ncbi:MAG: hypothetical protein V7642_4765 [Burkholderiales bacterium]